MKRRTVSVRRLTSCAGFGALLLVDVGFAADSSGDSLEEIVVTASKRAEPVQDVAAAVSVISGVDLQAQAKSQLSDYLANTPGVTVATSGSAGQSAISIRGISPIGGTSKVATYVDETPVGSSGIWANSGSLTLDLLPFDLDRLEVLSGPQGTLYGASSMGGLLKYVLTTPDTTHFTGELASDLGGVENGNKPQTALMGHVNVPLIDGTLAASVSGYYKYTPGYVRNAFSGEANTNALRQYGGRFALFWQPTDQFTLRINAISQTTESADDALEPFANPTSSAATASSPILVSGGTGYGRFAEYQAFLQPFATKLQLYSATADWNLGFADLVAATSWSRVISGETINLTEEFGSVNLLADLPAGLDYENSKLSLKKVTQEIRLTSPQTDFLSYQVGAFFTDERQGNEQQVYALDTTYQPIAAFAPYAAFVNQPTTYREYAVFGDATWKVASAFDITGGVRYSTNKQNYVATESGFLLSQQQSPPVELPSVPTTEHKTTWMTNARYHFSSDVMAYVRVATGYAPGGANTPYPGVPQTAVGSETLTSYEVGLKSEFLDRRALVNLAVYHINWQDIQLNALLNGVSYVTNGGAARSDGVELSATYAPIEALKLGFTSAYTDAHLTSLNADVSTPFILGAQLENVSRWTVSGTAEYGWALSPSITAHVGGGVRWIGQQEGVQVASGLPYFILPSYTLVDSNANVVFGPWTLRVYANNLTNARAYSFARLNQDAITGAVPQIDYALSLPRTIGAGVVFRF
jgi:outer membrane receptor protein involved in Fe transport